MDIIIKILIALVAFFHCYILWLEMFAWETAGKKVFSKFPRDLFGKTKKMAANQGLYNGFLAAGLIWTFLIDDSEWRINISYFFLTCVAIAGIYGAMSVDRKIFYSQALPAIVTIVLILIQEN